MNHLEDLVQRLGSVYLAAAAYNAGAGRIERELRRLPGASESDTVGDHTFFQIADRRNIRRETRDYVPKLIAAALIAKQPARYGFTEIQRLSPLVFDEVTIPDATGLDVLARLADTSVAALLELNPQFVRGITPPDGRSWCECRGAPARRRRGVCRCRSTTRDLRGSLCDVRPDAIGDCAALPGQRRHAAGANPQLRAARCGSASGSSCHERSRRPALRWSTPPRRAAGAPRVNRRKAGGRGGRGGGGGPGTA